MPRLECNVERSLAGAACKCINVLRRWFAAQIGRLLALVDDDVEYQGRAGGLHHAATKSVEAPQSLHFPDLKVSCASSTGTTLSLFSAPLLESFS